MPSSAKKTGVISFANPGEHLLAEFERIDLLIQARVNHARRLQNSDDFRGLYISEQEVDELLHRPTGLPRWAAPAATDLETKARDASSHLREEIAARAAVSVSAGTRLPCLELQRLFGLSEFEMDVVILC